MVTEYYTPYEHNHCVERNNVTLFKNLHDAVEYVRGTDGNGTLLKYERRVKIALREDAKPEYEIGRFCVENGFSLLVNTGCVDPYKVKNGGYVYRVDVCRIEVN